MHNIQLQLGLKRSEGVVHCEYVISFVVSRCDLPAQRNAALVLCLKRRCFLANAEPIVEYLLA